MQTFDAIVAGAGIWGCTVARRLAEAGKKVLVLEKRAAVGGNCRCEIDPETGIEVHMYGSHIFHTSDEEVWQFVNRFTKFNDYRHCVLAKTKKRGRETVGRESRSTADGSHLYHLPIGKTLLEEFFGVSMKGRNLKEFLKERIDASGTSASTGASRTHGDEIFDAFIRGYTSKQWGVAPEKVDPSIIARLKVRDNYSTDYFDDPHQGIPADGYNALFERMLDHPNILVRCNCELTVAADVPDAAPPDAATIARGLAGADPRAARYVFMVRGEGERWINSLLSNPTIQQSSNPAIYYSGPIDALFNYKYGALPWRTLRFERETLPVADYQGNSVVNYTDADVPFTRIHEFKHYHPEWGGERIDSPLPNPTIQQSNNQTIIMREYSAAWQLGDEPYYPIDNPDSRALLAKYQSEVDRFNQAIKQSNNQTILHIGGRLGAYEYFDMDKSIAAALQLAI